MRKILIPLLVAALLCLGIGAGAMADGNVFRFEKEPNTVFEGETIQLVLNREGDPASGEVTFQSKNEKAASVDAQGIVTGLSKGQSTIVATVKTEKKTYTAQLLVTVARKAAEVTVNTDKLPFYAASDAFVAPLLSQRENAAENELSVLVIPVKKSVNLPVTVLPKDATNRRVTTSVSDPAVATVRGNSVTAVAAGETILTIANELSPEVAVQYRVLVVQPVKKLKVETSAPSVAIGEQVTVTSSAEPEDASIKQVIWSSGSPAIVSVDENGTVTGLKRGSGRVIATAADGSNIRANISVKVVQKPIGMTLNKDEITVDVGRNTPVKPNIVPKDADNKKVIWSSSDESIATVNKDGRVTGVSVGECTVTCTSEEAGDVSASVKVHVQQPVKQITFNDTAYFAYAGETTQLAWTVEPADATNPKVTFSSSNQRIATVDENGVVTGVGKGEVYITAASTDGSNRKTRVRVRVGLHVTGVRMVREHAYIDVRESATAGATLEPTDAANHRMTWRSGDEKIVTVSGTENRVTLRGVSKGTTRIYGVTEDGGYETSLKVTVGDFDHGLKFRDFGFDRYGEQFWLSVRNDTNMTITQITAELEMYEANRKMTPVPINTRDGSNKVSIVWSGTLLPGQTTGKSRWKMVYYEAPADFDYTRGTVTLIKYQIDNDWVKTIRQFNRPWKEY